MPTIPTKALVKTIASAVGTLKLNLVLSISTIQRTISFMLSEGSAGAAWARPGPFAILSTGEIVAEAGRVPQASSLACSHCKTFGGGPRDDLDRFLQHKRSQLKMQISSR